MGYEVEYKILHGVYCSRKCEGITDPRATASVKAFILCMSCPSCNERVRYYMIGKKYIVLLTRKRHHWPYLLRVYSRSAPCFDGYSSFIISTLLFPVSSLLIFRFAKSNIHRIKFVNQITTETKRNHTIPNTPSNRL